MPELAEQMYCSQQIVIPPKFPYILKQFAKAAIKTQPHDLLRWSYKYFSALAEGTVPPVKLRLEYPVYSTPGGLSTGYLQVLRHQLYGQDEVQKYDLERMWIGACLEPAELERILCLCGAGSDTVDKVPLLIFMAVTAGFITKSLTQTMITLCEVLTAEPEGGSARIPMEHFILMYKHLAGLDASRDINYIDGKREDELTFEEEQIAEEMAETEEPTEQPYDPKILRSALNPLAVTSEMELEEEEEEEMGTIAGRQMSVTSGEFIVDTVKENIMDFINEQIALLPDPNLKKRKAKPEEVEMIKQIIEDYLEENIETIVPEQEEEQEEEVEPPKIVRVYAVPGIGARVPQPMIDSVIAYVLDCGESQEEMIMPRNIVHFLCPPLEVYSPTKEVKLSSELEKPAKMI